MVNKTQDKQVTTRFIGAQISPEMHKEIKMRCIELNMDLKEAIMRGLIHVLELNPEYLSQLNSKN